MPLDMDPARMPRHVAIIMDGNGRWAERHGLLVEQGHEAGALSVRVTISAARELGLKALTLYAFSTENWSRPQHEIQSIFRLFSKYARIEIDNMSRQNICMKVMGRYHEIDAQAAEDMDYCIDRTRNNTGMTLNVAINYGGRTELADAAKSIAAQVKEGRLAVEDITEETLARHLYVPELPDLDLMIRTSGEMRVSNFMLWQLSYAEMISLPVLWPDFRRRHLRRAVMMYQQRDRRFGGR